MHQRLHPDFETNPADTEYFFLGTGKIQAALQWSKAKDCTPLGLLIANPEHFARKWSTHLFHPEYGLDRTMATVIVEGVRYCPTHFETRASWNTDRLPAEVLLSWRAGEFEIEERIYAVEGSAKLVREFSIRSEHPEKFELEISLYANPASFSRFSGSSSSLMAEGYESLRIDAFPAGAFSERTLRIPFVRGEKGYSCALTYSVGGEASEHNELKGRERELEYWNRATIVRAKEKDKTSLASAISRLFAASCAGLRAAVAESGRFDASIWQYGYEWSGDAAMVAEALVYCGQFEVARDVLTNILTRLTNDDGMAMESSRFRGGTDAELNNNGEILKACCTYLEWTGDDELIRAHYSRIRAITDYLLRPEFVNAQTGMLMAARDIWERNAATGILPGYDIAHQTFAILGLRAAAKIALTFGHMEDQNRWEAAASRLEESFLNHPTHSMIEDQRVIKRRLLDGSVQTELRPQHADKEFMRAFVPKGMPLSESGVRAWEPDVSEVFPICFGLIDAKGNVATRTMQAMETLWSQAWKGGGYGRYNVDSEPDSPGPWPFATGYVAAAYLESGNTAMAIRAIEWLIEKAGNGGCWFEFYGDRPTPPLPPTGIIVWGWAQWVTLVIRHILGAKVKGDVLTMHPKLEGLSAEVRFRNTRVATS